MPKKCFVIAPIGQENSEIRARSDQIFSYVIKPAVELLVYEAIRGDQISLPGNVTSQVIEHLMEDELAIVDLTGGNPNVYYELAIRHGAKKPVIQIKETSESLPFDIVGTRTIDFDFRFIASMNKCKEEIIKQIQEIENNPAKVDTPLEFTEQAKPIGNVISSLEKITSEIHILEQNDSVENRQKVYDLTTAYNHKIVEAINDLPRVKKGTDLATEKSKHKVLWVDDYPSNNKAIMDVYRYAGIQFDLALDTKQSLEYLAKGNYDLIISDIGRDSVHDAGIKMIDDIKRNVTPLPPIFVYSSDKAIAKYGTIAKDQGAFLATSSARDLVLKMNEILNLE